VVVDRYQIGQIQRSFRNYHHCSFGWSIWMDGCRDSFVMGTTTRSDSVLMYILSYFYIGIEGINGGGSLSGQM